MRKYGRTAALALIAMMVLTLSGCTMLRNIGGSIGGIFTPNRQNDYAEMHLKLERDAVRYDTALRKVVDETYTRREGIITDPQWRLFNAGVENVRTVNEAVEKDMDEWGATGVRPAMLGPHADALLKAQNEVIQLVNEVKP